MPPRGKKRRHWPWVLAVFIMMAVAIGLGIRHVIKRAEPILRTRVIETLSARFKSKVELAELHVSVSHGLGVDGKGLKIFGLTDPNPTAPGVQPLLSIDEFSFGTGVRSLFRSPIHVATVYVKGMTMNLPPKEDRGQLNDMRGPQDEDEQTGKAQTAVETVRGRFARVACDRAGGEIAERKHPQERHGVKAHDPTALVVVDERLHQRLNRRLGGDQSGTQRDEQGKRKREDRRVRKQEHGERGGRSGDKDDALQAASRVPAR